MADSTKPPIYQQLIDFQNSAGCDQSELRAELNRFAQVLVDHFELDIDEFVVGIDRLRRNRLGQFRYGTNALGLRAEIIISTAHILASTETGEVWRIFGTLLHELLHAWQERHGKPGRRNYHNREFRRRSSELGLIVDQRGVTEYAPTSPFMALLEGQGIAVPDLSEPKYYQKPSQPKSKLQLWICLCDPPQRARIGKSEFIALCPNCNTFFQRK